MSLPLAKMPRAVIFDLDGTLVDSARDLHAAANVMLAGLGRDRLELGQITKFVGNGIPTLVERCLVATGGSDGAVLDHALARFLDAYNAAPSAHTVPYPGVLASLDALAEAGCVLGVCTNKAEGPTVQILEALGMASKFSAVVGGDTLDAMKPDPAPLLLCLDRLNTPVADALFVGDSEIDAATARAAGLPFALFTRGYRKSPVESFETAFAFDEFSRLAPFVLGTTRAA